MRRLLLLLLGAALVLLTPAVAASADDPGRPRQWNLDKVGAEAAWKVADGSGVLVAVVDSGADLAHEDLAGKLVPGHDFVDDDDTPQDAYGHGSHVSGIIGAATGNGRGIAGVAPGAKIMPIRVLGADGSGNLDDVVAGVRWAVAHGAKVINLSLGDDTQAVLGPSFGDALREAWAAGVVPVVSAGNQFLTGSGFSDEPAIVVAATNRDDGKPSYSSGVGNARWGMAAPGGELPDLGTDGAILSTYWTGKAPDQYAYLAGTSQAAPHVAAAVAILLSTGRFTPEQAVQRLLDTTVDIGPAGRDSTFGAGRLDLAAAVRGLTPAAAAARPATGTPAPAAAATSTTVAGPPAAPAAPAVGLPPTIGVPPSSVPISPPPPAYVRARPRLPPTDGGGAPDWARPAILAALLIAATGAAAEWHRRSASS